MTSDDEISLLSKIFKVFLSAGDRPLNFSQICEAVKGDSKISALRKEIKGAFSILEVLGVVKCVYNRPTTKLWKLRDPIPFNVLGERAEKIFTDIKESLNISAS